MRSSITIGVILIIEGAIEEEIEEDIKTTISLILIKTIIIKIIKMEEANGPKKETPRIEMHI